MKKKISASFLLIIYIFMLCPVAFTVSDIEAGELTTISAASYERDSSSAITVDSSDSSRIIVDAGGYASYSINVVKAGYYKLLIYGKHFGTKPKITVSGIEENPIYGIGITSNTDRRHTIGRFYLSEGINNITLTFESGKVNISKIIFKCVEHEVSAESENIIEAHDYLKSNITSYDREDIQWSYASQNTNRIVLGPVIVSYNETAKRVCTYKLNVEKAGLYRLILWASGNGRAEYTLHSSDMQIAKATFVPSTSLGVLQCESASFETFNLNAGEQEITIKASVNTSNLYTYYYVLDRIGEMVVGGEVSSQGESLIEGESLFYSDTGVETIDGAMKISAGSIARADLTVAECALYAVIVSYKSDSDSSVSLCFGNDDTVYLDLAKTEGNYIQNIYQIKNLDSGLLRLLFSADSEIFIDSVKFCRIDETKASEFVSLVNLSENKNDLDNAFDVFKESTGVDYKNASQPVFYKAPLYARLLNEEYRDIDSFFLAFSNALKNESINQRSMAYKGTERILDLENGDISVVLDTLYFNQMDVILIAAIYEEGSSKKLVMLDSEYFEGQPEITFDFNDVVIDDNKTYSFDILYFENLNNATPIDMLPSVYKKMYVTVNGSDSSGSGTIDAPFATIQKAVETASGFNAYQWGDIIINVESGIYTLDDTLTFDETKGGKNGFKIKIVGNEENHPVISGGIEVTDWRNEGDGIYSAPLSGVEYVRNLYINGYPAVRARSESKYKCGDIYHEDGSEWEKDGFSVLKSDVPYSFSRPDDLEFVWTYEFSDVWESRRTPVESIFETDSETTFVMKRPIFNYAADKFQNGQLFYIENAMELLDTPGEFYYNKAEEKIYYMPYPEENMEAIETYVGNIQKMVEIKGSSPAQKAENVSFENLIFRYGAYDFASENGYNGTQSDGLESTFVSEDGSNGYNAQLEVYMASGIEIRNCEISCMGSAGIHFSDGVTDSAIEENIIRDLSGTGITIRTSKHTSKKEGMEVCKDINGPTETTVSSLANDGNAMLTVNEKVVFLKSTPLTLVGKSEGKIAARNVSWNQVMGTSCSGKVAFFVLSAQERNSLADLIFFYGDGVGSISARVNKYGIVSRKTQALDENGDLCVDVTVMAGEKKYTYKLTEETAKTISERAYVVLKDVMLLSGSDVQVLSHYDLTDSYDTWEYVTGIFYIRNA